MKIAVIQHAELEGPGAIRHWAKSRGHVLSSYRADLGQLPSDPQSDGLIVLGGAYSVNQRSAIPWLQTEYRWLGAQIRTLPAFGICLGAQLLAHLSGARVLPAEQPEIGWVSIDDGNENRWMLQWREECFELPAGAICAATNSAWLNQGFVLGRIVGFQFHPEWTPEMVQALIDEDPTGCPLTSQDVQATERYVAAHEWLARRLDEWIGDKS